MRSIGSRSYTNSEEGGRRREDGVRNADYADWADFAEHAWRVPHLTKFGDFVNSNYLCCICLICPI
jgi:hypothetical protein